MSRCPTCDEFTYESERHRCPPAWYCWVPGDGEERDDARTVYELDAERAAEKLIDRQDPDCDYACVSGNPVTVCVAADSTTEEIAVFEVTGEEVPQYRAEEVKPKDGRMLLCVATRYYRGTQWWVELASLEGKRLGGFTYPTQDTPTPPDPGDCVQVEGTFGQPGATIHWGRGYSWSIEQGAA